MSPAPSPAATAAAPAAVTLPPSHRQHAGNQSAPPRAAGSGTAGDAAAGLTDAAPRASLGTDAKSACWGVDGFRAVRHLQWHSAKALYRDSTAILPCLRAVDTVPERSPLSLADALLPHVKGRRYCQIGTRKGDHLSCLTAFQ
eukprot:gene54477-biopygen113588